jgi:DnaJ family protein B protein 12
MSSIANLDEAEKCIDIAKLALRTGDKEKAVKFLNKSIKLYETQEALSLLDTLLKQSSSTSSESNHNSSNNNNATPPKSSHHHHTRSHTHTSTSTSTASDSEPSTSADEIAIIARIKKGKTHYEVLGVEKQCDDKQVKVAYRKLAVKVHPDKNKHPGSEEAFKLVSNAFQILSDPVKRKQYDLHGDDSGGIMQQQQRAYQQATRNAFYTNMEDDITPEEIFNMFFTGMAGGARPRQFNRNGRRAYQSPFHQQHFHFTTRGGAAHQQQQQQHQGSDQSPGLMQFAHFIPIILLILFSFMSMPSGDEHIFTLHRTASMPIQRQTQKYETPYFVDRNFMHRYGRDSRAIHQVDQQVEHAMYKHYAEQCQKQTHAKQEAIKNAQYNISGRNQADALNRANNMATDACEKATEHLTKT